ncbi:MAG: hypothetical protein GY797_12180 [Deltaproteobacteria bacterium]|nr:hypothetical protein [Deltaproteobacteria bacterium]
MSSSKITEIILQAFLRFFVPGMVVIIFTILLPSCVLSISLEGTSQVLLKVIKDLSHACLKLVDQPMLFILISISVGILLDVTRFYNFFTIRYFSGKSSWIGLKIALVTASGIETNDGIIKDIIEKDNSCQNVNEVYKKRIENLAWQIHSVFIKANHPDVDHSIENSRTYPDILSTSLLSLIAGNVFLFFALIFLIILKILKPEKVTIYFSATSIIIILLISFIIWFYGKKKVAKEYEKLNELTKSLVNKVFSEKTEGDACYKKIFFVSMRDEFDLIVYKRKKWMVNEKVTKKTKKIATANKN